MTQARLHMVYYYFLSECCSLTERDTQEVARVWGISKEEAEADLIRSVPSRTAQIIVMPELARTFDYDLHGIAGFWYDYKKDVSLAWKVNLKRNGLLKPYTDERGRIQGIYVYRAAWDTRPCLLTSHGLTLGTEAIQPERLAA